MIRIVESDFARGDDSGENDGSVGVDKTSSSLGDSVELGTVDDGRDGSSGGLDHGPDKGGGGQSRILSDKKRSDPGDEGTLPRREGKEGANQSFIHTKRKGRRRGSPLPMFPC